MKGLLITTLLIVFSISVKAQNLVKNPGFEFFYDCPIRIGQFSKTKDWFSGNAGTPELYHLNCKEFFIEEKLSPFSGNGYVGLILHCQYKEAIEYIGTELSDSLEKDQEYCLSFWVRAKTSPFYISNLGAIFRKEDPSISYWGGIRDLFDVRNESGFITPDMGWVQVSGRFTAKGGEKFLVLGNFAEADQTATLADINGNRPQMGWMSYYYIDEVKLSRFQESEGCPTESQKLEAIMLPSSQDSLRLTLYFDFDRFVLKPSEKLRLDSLLNSIRANEYNHFISGHTDEKGSIGYNLNLSKRRAEQISSLIRSESTEEVPIKISFDGESSPTQTNSTVEGRAANRRVELLLIRNYETQ